MDYRTCRVSSGFFLPNETGVWSFSGYADDRLALWLGHQWPQQCAVKDRLIAPEEVAIPHNLYLNASHYGVDIKKYPSQIGSFCFTPKDCEQYNGTADRASNSSYLEAGQAYPLVIIHCNCAYKSDWVVKFKGPSMKS
jgi:hypothetical protein